MTEPPPRKRLQIHLSTAIVMMFVAGGLMWANFNVPITEGEFQGTYFAFNRWHDGPYRPYGWPLKYSCDPYRGDMVAMFGSFNNIAIDIFVAIVVLFAAWLLCEWLIRRAAQKES